MKIGMALILLATTALAADSYTGWVSDEACARARAHSGSFTATNPDCARKCVSQGKPVVLVSEELKQIFVIDNPESLKEQVGNKVRLDATAPKSEIRHASCHQG